MLADYRWSSFPGLIGDPDRRPGWWCAEWVLGRWGEKAHTPGAAFLP